MAKESLTSSPVFKSQTTKIIIKLIDEKRCNKIEKQTLELVDKFVVVGDVESWNTSLEMLLLLLVLLIGLNRSRPVSACLVESAVAAGNMSAVVSLLTACSDVTVVVVAAAVKLTAS